MLIMLVKKNNNIWWWLATYDHNDHTFANSHHYQSPVRFMANLWPLSYHHHPRWCCHLPKWFVWCRPQRTQKTRCVDSTENGHYLSLSFRPYQNSRTYTRRESEFSKPKRWYWRKHPKFQNRFLVSSRRGRCRYLWCIQPENYRLEPKKLVVWRFISFSKGEFFRFHVSLRRGKHPLRLGGTMIWAPHECSWYQTACVVKCNIPQVFYRPVHMLSLFNICFSLVRTEHKLSQHQKLYIYICTPPGCLPCVPPMSPGETNFQLGDRGAIHAGGRKLQRADSELKYPGKHQSDDSILMVTLAWPLLLVVM